ncbi:unnamed protein product [Cuscuta europaea]|uniref:Uncharacterized protein n=1 Tax=Cuscuta europaea TaxID=41803 RepID=A0A9P1E415_CUSEU|nr:unnamed protein product [Cuscuta europaea]
MTEHEGSGRSEAMESIISRYDNLVIGEEKNEQVFEEGDDREEADNEGKACDDVVALGKPKTEERRVLDTRPAEVSEKHYGKARQLELLVVLELVHHSWCSYNVSGTVPIPMEVVVFIKAFGEDYVWVGDGFLHGLPLINAKKKWQQPSK